MFESSPTSPQSRLVPRSSPPALLWLPGNCIPSTFQPSQRARMLSGALRPLTRRFTCPQRTTNHHDHPRQIDPVCRIKDHFLGKSSLYGVTPTSYPVAYHLPIERADIHHG